MRLHTNRSFSVLLGGKESSNLSPEQRERIQIKVGHDNEIPPTNEEMFKMPIDGARVYLWHEPSCGGIFEKGQKEIRCGKCSKTLSFPEEAKTIADFPANGSRYLKVLA